MMRIGVIGYGYWGPNVVRNFSDLAEAQVTVVSDSRPDRLAQAERRYPGLRVTADPLALIADPAVDAVAANCVRPLTPPLSLSSRRTGLAPGTAKSSDAVASVVMRPA